MNETKSPRSFDTGSVSGIIGYRLRRAQVSVFQQFMARFAEFGLTPAEYSVLALIAANPGSKQTQVGEALGIKRANFVTLVNALEARGAALDASRRLGDEPHHAVAGDGLAGAGLADDAEGLALPDGEGDVVHRPHHAVAGVEVGLEVVDFEEGHVA